MNVQIAKPSRWRVLLGFLLAPAVTAAFLAFYSPLYAGLPDPIDRAVRTFPWYLIVGGYLPLAFLGIPVWLILRKRMLLNLLNCAMIGTVIAALPVLLLRIIIHSDYEHADGHVLIRHYIFTSWGWWNLAQIVGEMALLGMVTGKPVLVDCGGGR